MLGRFNRVEQRGFLSMLGLASVGMAIGFSYGFCSLLGLAYGPLHNIIPFLLLGIGELPLFSFKKCKPESSEEKFFFFK
jgi:Niemann-Pick C1 protein